MGLRKEHAGVIFALSGAAMWGLFPILVNRGARDIPPLFFAAVTTLLAAVGCFVYAAARGELHELTNKKAYASLIMVTLFIVVIPYTLFFAGSSLTSGLNSSMLLLSEIVFTLLFTPLIGERTTWEKVIGALGVTLGAGLILFDGKISFNTGDLLIVFSTLTYPIGNFYAKKALNQVPPSIILLVRFLLGGSFILMFSIAAEAPSDALGTIWERWALVLFIGLVLLGVSKVVWYEGLKRLDISKAISLAMTFPFFSLLFLAVLFNEYPSGFQWAGILVMMAGAFVSIRRKSTDARKTGYGRES